MFAIGRKRECRRVRDKLSEYIDDRLGIDERDSVESHLESCDACSKELETLRMTVRLLNQVPMVPVPRSFAIREMEADRKKVPEPRGWGGLRPVPVFAVSGVDSARAGIFDPQRMRWLRPASAVVATALVLLLMLDFLQVVPHGGRIDSGGLLNEPPSQTVVSPSLGAEQDGLKLEGEELVEPPPVPLPLASPQATSEDAASGLFSSRYDVVELEDEAEGGWPMRQLEIAAGAILFAMVGMMIFTRRLRRRSSRA